jgi:hypothetical protein
MFKTLTGIANKVNYCLPPSNPELFLIEYLKVLDYFQSFNDSTSQHTESASAE